MARQTALTNSLILGPNVAGEVTSNSLTANTPAYIDSTELDERTVIRISGSSSAEVTISKGTGHNGAEDLVFDVDGTVALTLDSLRFAIVGGEDAGLIKITSTAAVNVEIIQVRV